MKYFLHWHTQHTYNTLGQVTQLTHDQGEKGRRDFWLKIVESTHTFSTNFLKNYVKIIVKGFLQRWGERRQQQQNGDAGGWLEPGTKLAAGRAQTQFHLH